MLEYWYQFQPCALKRALHITPNKLLEGDRILNQHPGWNRRREAPSLRALLFNGRVGPGDGLSPSAYNFSNTPFLSLRHTLNLSIELVRKLYLSTNHELII
jgi:hypothetical protein